MQYAGRTSLPGPVRQYASTAFEGREEPSPSPYQLAPPTRRKSIKIPPGRRSATSLTFEMRWTVCILFVSLQFWLWSPSTCDTPSRPKRYAVNLDLEPQERWKEVAQDFASELSELLKAVEKLVPPEVIDIVSIIEADVETYLPYPYNLEIVGIAANTKVHAGVGNCVSD